MLQNILIWIIGNSIELAGTIFGLLYIVFSMRQSIWCWPIGFVTSALYISVFFSSKFYADMSLQVYYVFISIYGWYHWMYGSKSKKNDDLKITKINARLMLILSVITGVLFVFIAFILVKFTDSEIPYWDAFTTAASFVATWMLARKILENWLVWVLVDAISLGLYIYKGLYPTVVLFMVYTVLAVLGYYQWKKSLKKQEVIV